MDGQRPLGLLYDQNDIWEVWPDGSGAAQCHRRRRPRVQISSRHRSLDPEQRVVPADKPLLLAAIDDRTEPAASTACSLTGAGGPERS